MLLGKVRDEVGSVFKITLFLDLRGSVSSECKDVLNSLCLKNPRELIDLRLVIVEWCQMHHRLHSVPVLDVLCDLDGTVAVAAAARTESNAYKIRFEFTKHLERFINALKLGVLLGRKDLKRKTLFISFVKLGYLHFSVWKPLLSYPFRNNWSVRYSSLLCLKFSASATFFSVLRDRFHSSGRLE